VKDSFTARNQIIRSLSGNRSRAFLAQLRQVRLDRNTILYEAHKPVKSVYFPEDAVITFFGETGHGGQIELWSVGHEGIAGVPGFLNGFFPYHGIVTVAGRAAVTEADTLRQFMERYGELHETLCHYSQRLIFHVAQMGLCNSAHGVEQRFGRWLLLMQQRTRSRTLRFTQDFIARVLGTRRATISEAAANLQAAGLINCTSGSITIVSRRGLAEVACACFQRVTASPDKRKTAAKSSRK